MRSSRRLPSLSPLLLVVGACAGSTGVRGGPAPGTASSSSAIAPVAVVVPPSIRAALAAQDRSGDDRALDASRLPGELLAFAGVREGEVVGEVGSWHGYTSELLARVVGPSGHVVAEDPSDFKGWIAKAWSERASRSPVAARIEHVYRPFEDPFGADTPRFSAVFSVLFYHDTVWLGVDRARMNAAIYASLAPGGAYVVVDHSARPGEGVTVAKTLHRIEEGTLTREIEGAGFVLASRADFLRHPDDARDWNAGDEGPEAKRGHSDRFVLLFKRP